MAINYYSMEPPCISRHHQSQFKKLTKYTQKDPNYLQCENTTGSCYWEPIVNSIFIKSHNDD